MDHCASVLMAFPPSAVQSKADDNELFENAMRLHTKSLEVLFKEQGGAIGANAIQLLDCLDPSLNSLSYLALLDLVVPASSEPLDMDAVVIDKIVTFLLTFDPRQIRFIGSTFSKIFSLIGSGQVIPPSVAADILTKALLRVDPTSSMLTSNHITLIKLAYQTDNVVPALPVISKNIIFYPGMTNQTDPKILCDPGLSPPAFISKNTGLTFNLKASMVLEYDYTVGLMFCSVRDWAAARAAFERVVSYPTRDGGVSKIMTEAHKKWILVGLLLHGKTATYPPHTASLMTKSANVLAKPYLTIAESFDTLDASALKTAAQAGWAGFVEDVNEGLMREVIAAHQKWQIVALRSVFSKISLSGIRAKTRSAETGEPSPTDADIEALVRAVLAAGMLPGATVLPATAATGPCLEFAPEAAAALSEEAYAAELRVAAERVLALQPLLRTASERMTTSKEYVRHLVKEQKQREKDSARGGGGGGGTAEPGMGFMGFDDPMEDEDLMVGVTPTH